MRCALTLAAAACLPLAAQAQQAPLADVFSGVYELDCEPVGPVHPTFVEACKTQRAAGKRSVYRLAVDAAGQWTVSPPLAGGEAGSQSLAPGQHEGHRCLQAMMVAVCEVPRDADMFRNVPPESNVRSRSGLVLMATNVGVMDLKKVAKQ